MNKQEQAQNAKSKVEKLHNIRTNYLIQLEQELSLDSGNAELVAKVNSYRTFIAREENMKNRLFDKMGWN